jgi:hypothetical protein
MIMMSIKPILELQTSREHGLNHQGVLKRLPELMQETWNVQRQRVESNYSANDQRKTQIFIFFQKILNIL